MAKKQARAAEQKSPAESHADVSSGFLPFPLADSKPLFVVRPGRHNTLALVEAANCDLDVIADLVRPVFGEYAEEEYAGLIAIIEAVYTKAQIAGALLDEAIGNLMHDDRPERP